MKYYVTSDTHGFYTELKTTLTEKGFFEDKKPHKLIICGDLFDRGEEALKLQDFILNLMERDEIILIRGNHEDLTMELINEWNEGSFLQYHHRSNGTISTMLQLTDTHASKLLYDDEEVRDDFLKTPLITTIIPAMVNFYETKHYIFVHGWIPCFDINNSATKNYVPINNWRNTYPGYWNKARWINGMEAARCGIIEKNKTIVCGHWHCSFGHSKYEGDGGEFDNNPNFKPYYAEGIIALDACTAFSKKVNVIVIED